MSRSSVRSWPGVIGPIWWLFLFKKIHPFIYNDILDKLWEIAAQRPFVRGVWQTRAACSLQRWIYLDGTRRSCMPESKCPNQLNRTLNRHHPACSLVQSLLCLIEPKCKQMKRWKQLTHDIMQILYTDVKKRLIGVLWFHNSFQLHLQLSMLKIHLRSKWKIIKVDWLAYWCFYPFQICC